MPPSSAEAVARIRPTPTIVSSRVDGKGNARVVVGIGEYAVSADAGATLVTHALGSCVAVCLWDPAARVAGLLHFLLPESRVNPVRAQQQPATFADLGIPLLFQAAYELGATKPRCVVRLVGGADVSQAKGQALMHIGRRNQIAAKNMLWRNGVLITAERLGGAEPRNVALSVSDGRLRITSASQVLVEL